jgi:hypothetical protein
MMVVLLTNLSVIILLVSVYNIAKKNGNLRPENNEKVWYYDLNTGRLFVEGQEQPTQITAPSGFLPDGSPAGIRAYVFSYVKDPNESQRFIGYLEKKDPNYIANSKTSDNAEKWKQGMLIRKIDDTAWYRADSLEGREILRQALAPNKDGENPYYCPPPSNL